MDARPHRRRVLELASSGFLAWGVAPLAGGCSRRSAQIAQEPAKDLEDAWKRAQAASRPLLVLLADPSSPADRGVQWSAYFDLASDRALAEMSSCELAFASPAQIRAVEPSIAVDETELPHALVVEPDGRTVISVPVTRPEPNWTTLSAVDDPEPLRDWIARVETAVHAALASSSSLPRIDSDSEVRERAESLRRRLRDDAPAGGKWAKRFGICASVEFEDGSVRSESGILCGMGFQSEKSRRFLWLYSES